MKRIVICLAWAVAALAAAAPAVAQEQRASIEGTIRDSSGGRVARRHRRSAQPVSGRRRKHDQRLVRHVPVSGAAARPLRSDRDPAGISAGEAVGCAPGARSDPQSRSGDGRRRARRDGEGHRRITAHRRQAIRRPRLPSRRLRYRDQFNVADSVFFGGFDPAAVATAQNFRPDARFGLASGFQDPRVIRLQAKVSF